MSRSIVWAVLGSVAAATAAVASPDSDYATGARTYLTPAIGGRGGAPFRIECQNRDYLVGVNLRFDGWLDQIDGLCAMFRAGQTVTEPQEAMGPGFNAPRESGWGGRYGAAGLAAGGQGGRMNGEVRCPSGMVVTNLNVSRSAVSGMVANVSLTCSELGGERTVMVHQNPQVFGPDEAGWFPSDGCKSDSRWYYAARGLHGRAGSHVDAIGLICSAFQDGKYERPGDRRAAEAAAEQARRDKRLRDGSIQPPPSDWGQGRLGGNAVRIPREPGRWDGSRRQQSATVRYDRPALSLRPRTRFAMDWCLTWGDQCGKPAADAFCSYRDPDRPYAVDFNMAQDIGVTQIFSTGEVCRDPACDGFTHIVCSSEPPANLPPR
jgi:hypothetical protein